MLRRLERDATKADLAAVEALLSARTPEEDPIGHLQFSKRAAALAQRLQELEAAPSTGAEVGLFFGGRPVVGSYGIMAEFGAKVISEFQNLISSTSAAADGTLGARGPVPQRDQTQLLLTDVARGSFGFILQQAEEHELVDGPMKEVVSRAVDLVFRVASPDQEAFDDIADRVDGRVLGSLRSFFKILDDAGATVRFVEDEREFTLQRGEVVLARERTENATLEEAEEEATGTLYILPDARRFELHRLGGEGVIKGTIAPDCLISLTGGGPEVRPGIIGTVQSVRMRVREIQSRGHGPKRSYALLSLQNLDLAEPSR
jgi:hypothetical protein